MTSVLIYLFRTDPDLFVLLAAMQMDLFVVSAAFFHDHSAQLAVRDQQALFRRWTTTRCITLDWNAGLLKVNVQFLFSQAVMIV